MTSARHKQTDASSKKAAVTTHHAGKKQNEPEKLLRFSPKSRIRMPSAKKQNIRIAHTIQNNSGTIYRNFSRYERLIAKHTTPTNAASNSRISVPRKTASLQSTNGIIQSPPFRRTTALHTAFRPVSANEPTLRVFRIHGFANSPVCFLLRYRGLYGNAITRY